MTSGLRLRRSKGARNARGPVALNLIPILDTLVTLIAFLLFTMSFLALVHMESPIPVIANDDDQSPKETPLQLTLTLSGDTESPTIRIWSPFDKIAPVTLGFDPVALHRALASIKIRFPQERKLVLIPDSKISYNAIISVMDQSRSLTDTDPAVFLEQGGVKRAIKDLFPDIVFGNLLTPLTPSSQDQGRDQGKGESS